MAGRYQSMLSRPEKWHDQKIFDIRERLKASTDVAIQHWP
jgi:hypothetical protein